MPCSDLIIAVGPNASGEPSDSSAAYAVLCRSPLARPRLMCFSGVSGFHLGVCAELRRLDGGPRGSRCERAEPRIETTDTAPGPGEPSCVLYQQKHSASVRNRSKILPVHVYSKQFNNTVQGCLPRHILNYTGYNQKQDRSVDSAKKIQHKSIYINIGEEK